MIRSALVNVVSRIKARENASRRIRRMRTAGKVMATASAIHKRAILRLGRKDWRRTSRRIAGFHAENDIRLNARSG
ncbi:hypothetical protein DYGSA30_12640 [Dyella sp. GSA-30]|nr:hypothetical protein DYGSA30_12640 [Dyella sp. GSA-30]